MQTTRPTPTALPTERRYSPIAAPARPSAGSAFPYKKLFIFALVAATVAGTVVGTSLLLNSRAADVRGSGYQGAAADGPRVVAFGHVDVDGKPVEINPVQFGRVEEVYVKENQAVRVAQLVDDQNCIVQVAAAADRAAGEGRLVKRNGCDVLFNMDTRQMLFQLKAAEAALAVADAQFKQAQDLKKQHADLVLQQEAAVAAEKAQLKIAQAGYDRAKRLENIDGSKEQVAAAAALVEKATQSINAEEAKLRALQGRNIQLEIDRASGDLRAKQSLVDQARSALEECYVIAPSNGTILRLMVSKGDVLGPTLREPAVLFCPAGKRIIRAEVEQEWASRVQKNQRVLIQDDARLSGEWNGTVRNISDWYSQRRSKLLEPRQFNDVRTLEVIIDLDADDGLRIGQRVRVIFGK